MSDDVKCLCVLVSEVLTLEPIGMAPGSQIRRYVITFYNGYQRVSLRVMYRTRTPSLVA